MSAHHTVATVTSPPRTHSTVWLVLGLGDINLTHYVVFAVLSFVVLFVLLFFASVSLGVANPLWGSGFAVCTVEV